MIPVALRRAGLGPLPAPGFQDGQGRSGRPGAAPGAPPPSGLGAPPPPRFKLSGAQYMSGRADWKSFLHQRSATKHEGRAARQAYRGNLAELTGGRLSTGRSHRGFHSAMGAYARRAASSGAAPGEGGSGGSALAPYRPGASARSGGGGGDLHEAMNAYFAKREARRGKYAAMRGGVSPQRARSFGSHGEAPGRPSPAAIEAPASGVEIEDVSDAPD